MLRPLPALDFVEAVKLAVSRITEMNGRSRRSEFWWTMLAVFICNAVFSFIPYVGSIVSMLLFVAVLPLMIRRLHDTGRGATLAYIYTALAIAQSVFGLILLPKLSILSTSSSREIERFFEKSGVLFAIFGLIALVMCIVGIIALIFWCSDSQPFANQYGPSPKYIDDGQQMYGQPPYGQPQQPLYGQPQQPPYGQPQQGWQQPQQQQWQQPIPPPPPQQPGNQQ